MPVTTIDPKTALLVIDMQKGIIALPAVHPVEAVIQRTRELLAAFRSRNLPVVLVNVAGAAAGRTEHPPRLRTFPPEWVELIPQLDQQPGDIVMTKHSWGAFATTNLESLLRARDVTQVVVAGVATSAGVESTARQAYEAGFHVTLARDAMTDTNEEAHRNSLTQIFPRLGEIGPTAEIINLLPPRSI